MIIGTIERGEKKKKCNHNGIRKAEAEAVTVVEKHVKKVNISII